MGPQLDGQLCGSCRDVTCCAHACCAAAHLVPAQDALCLGASNTVLMIVPMFHANSWGLNFAAPIVGCKLVLPGPALEGAALYHLIQTYQVNTHGGPLGWPQLLVADHGKAGLLATVGHLPRS